MVLTINTLTIFCTVIFLQVLMFLKNAVPITTNIHIGSGISLTYFIMSLITLIFLFATHEGASNIVVGYQPICCAFYGLTLLIMVIIGAINDLGTAEADAEKVYKTLSDNS